MSERSIDQKLVVIPGQFKPTGFDAANNIIGVERLYHGLSFELLRSTLNDWQSPVINGVDFRALNDTTVAVSVNASDPSGIARIVVLRINNGGFTSTSLVLNPPSNGTFTLNVPFTTGDTLLVQVVDAAGNIASSTGKGANISVINVSAPAALTVNENSPLTLQATLPAFNSLIGPVFYIWDFGDGTTSLEPVASHIYGSSGEYKVNLTVTDTDGATAIASVTITVEEPNQVPAAMAKATPASGEAPLTVNFDGTGSSDSDGEISSYAWSFGQGGEASGASASHVYTEAGEYTAVLTVTDDDGATATDSITITASAPVNQSPTVTLSASPTSGTTPLTVDFTATTSDSDGSIVSYEWDYDGDGTYDQNTGTSTTSHTFSW